MANLTRLYNVTYIRFWGKYLGVRDYFVVQAVAKIASEDVLGKATEPRGEGLNEYTYWVTTDLKGSWQELPLIGP
jgi:radial spoke head protein 4A